MTGKQQRAVQALLQSKSVAQAAQTAGVSERTLYRWLGEADFRAALRQAELEALQAFSGGLVSLSQSTMQALKDGLSPAEPITVRLRAAGLVLDAILKVRELVTVEERLTALEERCNAHTDSQATLT